MTNEMVSPPVRPIRLAVVQPVMSPVRRPLFEMLAKRPDITVKVFVLTNILPHRPTWTLKDAESFDVEVVSSLSQRVTNKTKGGRDIVGVRLVPLNLMTRILSWRPDIVMCGNVTELLSILPLRILFRLPVVLGVEDTEVTVAQYPAWRQRVRAIVYRRATTYVPYGNAAINYLSSTGVQTERMFNGKWSVDNTLYHGVRSATRRSMEPPYQWITVGQLVPRKGFAELLRAWVAQSADFLAHNKLVIVGEGYEYDRLSGLIDDLDLKRQVALLGYHNAESLARLYGESHAFVFPTLLDHWGLVVNEAMASGLPILCSKYAGCSLDLVTRKNGLVFDPCSATDFAKALAEFWKRRNEWVEMGTISERIISTYTLAATADAMMRATNAAFIGGGKTISTTSTVAE